MLRGFVPGERSTYDLSLAHQGNGPPCGIAGLDHADGVPFTEVEDIDEPERPGDVDDGPTWPHG
jgi:hypothetical protein